jgi:hypothetical protein
MTMHARPHAPPRLSPPSPNTSYRCQACRCEANAAIVNADALSALLRRHGAGRRRRRVRQGRDLQPVLGADCGADRAPHELDADDEPEYAGANDGDVGPDHDSISEPRAVDTSAKPAAHSSPDAGSNGQRVPGRLRAAWCQMLPARVS